MEDTERKSYEYHVMQTDKIADVDESVRRVRDEVRDLGDRLDNIEVHLETIVTALDRYLPLIDRFANNPAAKFAARMGRK